MFIHHDLHRRNLLKRFLSPTDMEITFGLIGLVLGMFVTMACFMYEHEDTVYTTYMFGCTSAAHWSVCQENYRRSYRQKRVGW